MKLESYLYKDLINLKKSLSYLTFYEQRGKVRKEYVKDKIKEIEELTKDLLEMFTSYSEEIRKFPAELPITPSRKLKQMERKIEVVAGSWRDIFLELNSILSISRDYIKKLEDLGNKARELLIEGLKTVEQREFEKERPKEELLNLVLDVEKRSKELDDLLVNAGEVCLWVQERLRPSFNFKDFFEKGKGIEAIANALGFDNIKKIEEIIDIILEFVEVSDYHIYQIVELEKDIKDTDVVVKKEFLKQNDFWEGVKRFFRNFVNYFKGLKDIIVSFVVRLDYKVDDLKEVARGLVKVFGGE